MQFNNPSQQKMKTKNLTCKKHCASALQITVSVTLICVSLILFASISGAGPANSRSQGVVVSQGELTSFTAQGNQNEAALDFANARPLLPLAPGGPTEMVPPFLQDLGTPGHSAGARGNGQTNPVTLPVPTVSEQDSDMEGAEPDEYGTGNQPFSTARADLLTLATNTQWPYRASGKLYFQDANNNTFVCSASMVKRGLVVTAAHCVANYGQSQFYHNWHFYPGYRNGSAPYGNQTVFQAWVKTSYFNGTDNCAQFGVICPNDVAILILNTLPAGGYIGTQTGWYGYGYGGFGFTRGITHITQTGYPVCLNNGLYMERNDSQGFVSSSNSSNTIIGSLMCGGSSGGPWLINFGVRPTLTGTTNGTYPNPNIVVGVTSWGYISNAIKQQGASPFTSNNILSLINSACGSRPAACM
jgi:V8-like Glu-specific endopeptidase